MQSKTKLQKQVVELSSKLPAITEKQKAWAIKDTFEKYATRSRKTLFCFECGQSWENEFVLVTTLAGCTCPNCKQVLKLKSTYTPAFSEYDYVAILTVIGGMQVVRMISVRKRVQKLKVPDYFIDEVMQHWIDRSGKVTTLSKCVMGFSMCYDNWIYSSEIEIRGSTVNACSRFNLSPGKIYPERKILPVIRRNGFKGLFHGMSPQSFFTNLLSSTQFETLLKACQYSMLRSYNTMTIDKYWTSVKICIRNNYIIKDTSMWTDQINLLKYFGKDLHNPVYVCPPDLHAAHQHLIEKKRKIEQRKKLEEQKKEIAKAEKKFRKEKGKFLGIQFTDGIIDVVVLDSVREYLEEGDELHHCVYSSAYYKKADSLCLSGRKDGQRLETVELSLRNMEIIQCRGPHNKNTEYHDRIVSLVRRNINVIQKRASSLIN